jgi:nucleoid DNA-binding protein
MKRLQLAKRLAKRSGLSRAAAADQLDHVVNKIISNLKKGHSATLPGLGQFSPGKEWTFEFEPPPDKDSS